MRNRLSNREAFGLGPVVQFGDQLRPLDGGFQHFVRQYAPAARVKPGTMRSLYEEIGGFDRVLALCKRWHALVLADPEAAHPFEHELHPQHDERLAAYLSQAFGGPPLYTAGYGDETSVMRIHACNGVHVELDEACLRQFDQALADVGIAGEAAARASAYFRRATEGQRAYSTPGAQVPDGLPFLYES